MNSQFHIDAKKISLESFRRSLASRELIPSRVVLKEKLESRFEAIHMAKIQTLGDLIGALKTKPKVEAFSKKTGLDVQYLTLLKREAGSYFSNPVFLSRFPGVDAKVISGLEKAGIKNSKQLFDKAFVAEDRAALSTEFGVSMQDLDELVCLSDLSRLYGVGPMFARIFYDVGIDSVSVLIGHSAERIVQIYEGATGKKADFSVKDLLFTLEMARELDNF
jgi:Domain of unknown function (DUF4332)